MLAILAWAVLIPALTNLALHFWDWTAGTVTLANMETLVFLALVMIPGVYLFMLWN